MSRKAIQIVVTTKEVSSYSAAGGPHHSHHRTTTALCDDGSIWRHVDDDSKGWFRLPPIPSEELERT